VTQPLRSSSTLHSSPSRRARPLSSTTTTSSSAAAGLTTLNGDRRLTNLCLQVFWNVVDEVLGVERGHASRSSRGDGLPIDMILNVSTREHARHACFRAVVRND